MRVATCHTAAQSRDPYFNLDLTATRKFGKMEIGSIAYGSWQLDCAGNPKGWAKANQFALGGLVGYDFGSASSPRLSFKLTRSLLKKIMATKNHCLVTIVKPLWALRLKAR